MSERRALAPRELGPRELGAGFALGLGLALAVAGPDLARLGAEIPGYFNTDAAGAVYLHDALHQALREGRWPGTDPNQMVPVGSPLWASNGGNSLEMALSGLTRLLLPWPAWYSLATLLWIPLNLVAFLPLGRHLWGRLDAALAGGALWAISPVALGELAAGRLTQVVGVGIPLAVLGLLRISERSRREDLVLAGAGLALTGIGYWFYAIFLALLTPLFFLWGRTLRPWRRLLPDLVGALGLAFALALPFAAPALLPHLSGTGPAPPLDPSRASPFFDNALRVVGEQPRQLRGWLPWAWVLGAGASLAWGRRQPLWLGLAGASVIFAVGPATKIGESAFWMPYALLWQSVPLLDRLTHPGRWLGVGALFLAVLAADGLARRAPAALWGLLALSYVQLWVDRVLPLGTWRLTLPPVWTEAARGQGALIVLPLLKSPLTCRWQPLARRPLLGGMLEQQPWAWPPAFRAFVEENALLMDLWALGEGQDREIIAYEADLLVLREAGFTGVLLDQESWSAVPAAAGVPVALRLKAALGDPEFSDPSGALWRLPALGQEGAPPPVELRLPEP